MIPIGDFLESLRTFGNMSGNNWKMSENNGKARENHRQLEHKHRKTYKNQNNQQKTEAFFGQTYRKDS